MKAKTSRIGEAPWRHGQAGFTLFELLIVFAVIALIVSAILVVPGAGSGTAALKSAAFETAAILRETRARAIHHGRAQTVLVDVARHVVRTGGGRKPLKIDRGIRMSLTAAAGERRAARLSGIRFFANGSSTGGTVLYAHKARAFMVRVNWLTGAVSIDAAR